MDGKKRPNPKRRRGSASERKPALTLRVGMGQRRAWVQAHRHVAQVAELQFLTSVAHLVIRLLDLKREGLQARQAARAAASTCRHAFSRFCPSHHNLIRPPVSSISDRAPSQSPLRLPMSAFVYFFGSGFAFFVGIALVLAALGLTIIPRWPHPRASPLPLSASAPSWWAFLPRPCPTGFMACSCSAYWPGQQARQSAKNCRPIPRA